MLVTSRAAHVYQWDARIVHDLPQYVNMNNYGGVDNNHYLAQNWHHTSTAALQLNATKEFLCTSQSPAATANLAAA